MKDVRKDAWPPTHWELRRLIADFVPAFHVSAPGFFVERLARGDLLLVEPAGPEGYRSTGLATVFTELASELPDPFEHACIRVGDVITNTELVETYDGELRYGSGGDCAFPFEASGWCFEVFESDRGFVRAWASGRVDSRVLADVLTLDSEWCEDPPRLRRFLRIVEDLRMVEELRRVVATDADFWQIAEPFLSNSKLGVGAEDTAGTVGSGFYFRRRTVDRNDPHVGPGYSRSRTTVESP